jgi:hypothetical protein
MGENVSFGELIAGIVYLVVAVRLYQRGRSDGGAAELLLAGAFFFVGISSVVYSIATMSYFESMAGSLNIIGRFLYLPAPVLMAIFTRRVFRENESWAAWLAWASPIPIAIGVFGSILFRNDWVGFSAASPWFWVEWAGWVYPFAWASVEAFLLYSKARRRVSLGLCAPLVCNRFLLWALFGALQVGAVVVVFPQYAQYEAENHFAAIWDVTYSGFLIGSLLMVWLVFFAPAFYRRWIGGSALTANTVES